MLFWGILASLVVHGRVYGKSLLSCTGGKDPPSFQVSDPSKHSIQNHSYVVHRVGEESFCYGNLPPAGNSSPERSPSQFQHLIQSAISNLYLFN